MQEMPRMLVYQIVAEIEAVMSIKQHKLTVIFF